jgi:tRNA nucleotidyltransferase (CCA-adding enzyme)
MDGSDTTLAEEAYARLIDGMRALPFPEIYEVGGSIRDELLGRPRKDADFLIRGVPLDELRRELGRHGKADDLVVAGRLVGIRFWPRFGPKQGVEVVPPRKEAPIRPGDDGHTGNPHRDFRIEADPDLPVEADLERRDFTVNAIARDIRSLELVDPFGGRSDLDRGVLRVVHETAFRDDPLRILRGLVRQSKDGLVPDERTRELMREWAPRIAELSAERVREALDQILSGGNAEDALRMARDVGALWVAVPELAHTAGVDQQSKRHALPLDEHLIRTVGEAARRRAPLTVRLAGLFHDIGKPAAKGASEPREHAELSARMTEPMMRRLTYDVDTIRHVCGLVRYHAYHEDREPTPLSARRFLHRVGRDLASDLLVVRRCDRAATGKPPVDELEVLRDRFETYVEAENGQPLTRGELAVDGNDLLGLGLSGPALGQVLDHLLEQVVEDPERNTRDWLLAEAGREAACSSAST